MRFEVPQFIDVEDKIFGPLTFKQFIYLAGGAGLGFASFKLIPFPFWIPISIGLVVFGGMLAFYKINNRPFIEIAQSWVNFKLKGKLYIWKRNPVKSVEKPAPVPVEKNPAPEKQVTVDTIKSLARNLDILDTYEK